MQILCLQQAPFETPGYISEWAQARGHSLAVCPMYETPALAKLDGIDLLVVLGGPMSANDPLPWIAEEKKLIRQAIDRGIKVLGICLGAQMIAAVLGAKVYRNPKKEIGWFPIDLTEQGAGSPLGFLPKRFMSFHWHGETFDLPEKAVLLATTPACRNQAFSAGSNTLALQFHLEMTSDEIDDLAENCADDIKTDDWVQDRPALTAGKIHLAEVHAAMGGVLDRFSASV